MIQLSRDITSPVHFVELKGNRFGHAIYHPSFTAEASMALKLRKGEGTQSDPWPDGVQFENRFAFVQCTRVVLG